MNLYKKITLFGLLFFAFATHTFAQSEQLAQVANPEYHNVPALTGDAAKDAEIRGAQARDLAQFTAYQTKAAEITGNASLKGMDYLYSMGFPKMTYTGNAHNDFQRFQAELRLWKTEHKAQLTAIQTQLEGLNKQ